MSNSCRPLPSLADLIRKENPERPITVDRLNPGLSLSEARMTGAIASQEGVFSDPAETEVLSPAGMTGWAGSDESTTRRTADGKTIFFH